METLTCKGKVEELSAPATAPATVSAGRECLSPSRFSDGSIKEVQALEDWRTGRGGGTRK